MCDVKECDTKPTHAPVLVFHVRDRVTGQRWPIEAIVGLRICEACRASITNPDDVMLPSARERIVRSILGMRANAVLVRITVAWKPLDHPDVKAIEASRPS